MTLDNDTILVIADEFWDDPKRVRHKMPLAWARAGSRVLWIEKPPNPRMDWCDAAKRRNALKGTLRQVEQNLWVGSAPLAPPRIAAGGSLGNALRALHQPLMRRRIRQHLRQLNMRPDLIVLFQQPTQWPILRCFPEATSLYYCSDLFGFGHGTAHTDAEERRCCEAVDAVFTTSEALRKRLAPYNAHTRHIPHAVDLGWWEENSGREPAPYAMIPRPRCVFTGVMGEGMDLALLEELAALRSDLQLVLVGPAGSGSDRAHIDRLDRAPNVHLLGPQTQEDLPGYIAGADLLMLPYLCDANRALAGLAVKFYEYCIGGHPILTTPYTDFETEGRDLLRIGATAQEWAALADEALARPLREEDETRRELARRNTYAARIEEQRRALADIQAHRENRD